MNAEFFAEWLQRQGHQVYRTESSYWYEASPRVLQAFPYHWLITPDENEINKLMLKHGIIALRYSTPLDSPEGMLSYHIVLNKCYDIEMLSSKARNGVKRGLSCFKVEKISFERLAHDGWILQQDTLARQSRLYSMKQKEWEQMCTAANGIPGFETFGATSEGELAAAAIVCRIDDVFNVPYAMSHCRFLRNHVNNALFFNLSCELLKREGVHGIFFCVQSLDAPENVDEFKFRMGFEPKPVRQHVEFHPMIKPFVNSTIHNLIRRLIKYFPYNPKLKKVEGMMRFYLEGKRPLKEQSWPDCLVIRKQILQESPLSL